MPDHLLSELIDLIPASQRQRGGGAFYSGRAAWGKPSRLYLIGYNPGGDANGPGTVMEHTEKILQHDLYSAYVTAGNPVNEPRWGTSMQASVVQVKRPRFSAAAIRVAALGSEPRSRRPRARPG